MSVPTVDRKGAAVGVSENAGAKINIGGMKGETVGDAIKKREIRIAPLSGSGTGIGPLREPSNLATRQSERVRAALAARFVRPSGLSSPLACPFDTGVKRKATVADRFLVVDRGFEPLCHA